MADEKKPAGEGSAGGIGSVSGGDDITNAQFLATIFPDLAVDEYLWTASFSQSPERGAWGGHAGVGVEDHRLNNYFCVSALREDAEGQRRRGKDHFSRLFCVVLDDAKGCDLAPTWRLETSEGNYQIGYRLAVPVGDLDLADRIHKALFTSAHLGNDKSGNNPVRYVRLPVGSHTGHDPVFRSRLVEWRPDVAYTVAELADALGLDLDDPFGSVESMSDAALADMVMTRKSYHEPLLKLSYRLLVNGDSVEEVIAKMQALMESADDRSERWQVRYDDIPRMVRDGAPKAAKKQAVVALISQGKTQDHLAVAIASMYEGTALYAHAFGAWYEWTGVRWAKEGTRLMYDRARDYIRRVNKEGKPGMAASAFCAGVETYLQRCREFAITGEEFDADNYLLNTPAGTVDLRTGRVKKHDPADKLTMVTAVAPSNAPGERFTQFLDEVTGGDIELARFLQVSLGACLSGAIESHWLLFWTGGGRNGKNTLGDLVSDVMGDYAKKVPASTLMAKRNAEHPTEIASLRGVRLATSSEINAGDHWDEARINELTGDSKISARFMRGDFFTFHRTHKHLIYGNHRPRLRSVTAALRARLKIVPFSQSFVGREDPMLPEKLRKESGAVLRWLIDGHAEWVALGRKLPYCEAVERESEAYFAEQSTVDMWLEERTRVVTEGRVRNEWPKASVLYADYSVWKRARGEGVLSQSEWSVTMRKFEKVKSNGWRYVGIELIEDDCSDLI